MSRERIVQIVQVSFTVKVGEQIETKFGISETLLVESAVSTGKSV
jgi:hypothetical protein